MSAPTLDAPVVTSLLPRDQETSVSLGTIANHLAAVIDRTRWTDVRVDQAVTEFVSTYRIALPEGRTPAQLSNEIMVRVFVDEVMDSEFDQALRAATEVLGDWCGSSTFSGRTMRVTGWMRDHQVVVGMSVKRLTGEPCPECGVNPECYGAGGGTECLDDAGCGWRFCF